MTRRIHTWLLFPFPQIALTPLSPPSHRLTEVWTAPYPIECLTMILAFEVGSAWSYLSYLVKSRGLRVLDALGLRKVCGWMDWFYSNWEKRCPTQNRRDVRPLMKQTIHRSN
jgi:hypothetical protein